MTNPHKLTVLVCTHNRAVLLERTLASLHAATPPAGWQVEILVAANACTDETHAQLEREAARGRNKPGRLPVHWFAEPHPGKAFALNSAIPRVRTSDLVAFVDDDQLVDEQYLVAACEAADEWPDFSIFCGRIVPDWDGTEPAWVHDEGPYRIRPRPVPQSGWGSEPHELTSADPTPGGGVLCLRGAVFDRVGRFSTELGPRGHDLGGSEDAAFMERAFALGERCRYVPAMLQYHYVDPERLRFSYVLRKAFHRARTQVAQRRLRTGIGPYQWRKLAMYALAAIFPPHPARLRFYLVHLAATLGEMAGQHGSRWQPSVRPAERGRTRKYLFAMGLLAIGAATAGTAASFGSGVGAAALAASMLALLLGLKSGRDFSLAGPRLPPEIIRRYRTYGVLAFGRLLLFAFLIAFLLAIPGVALHGAIAQIMAMPTDFPPQVLAGLSSVVILTVLQFLRHLLWLPANIAASYNYRLSRLYPLWRRMTPTRLRVASTLAIGIPVAVVVAAFLQSIAEGDFVRATAWGGGLGFYAALALWLRPLEARPKKAKPRQGQPNILLIGSDTLRADRVDGRHFRDTAPFLHRLGQEGVRFDQCFTPCARTTPSLLALLTGCWPQRMGVLDNFVPDEATSLTVPVLPDVLRSDGYWTGALSDWCGADMGKFDIGFDHVDVPEDQWNISLFIRQGPKDLRMFLSLFAHNRFGKNFLPEIYYLGGVPQTDALGREARHIISDRAEQADPFFLNVFFSTTHGPFGSEYPYYLRYASPDYKGESKFVMARVTDPWEIIRRQTEPRDAFDLDQIIDLYDGCVSRFDDEVRRLLDHVEQCGLADNTIVVVYSDHGMEFFEHSTWGQGNSIISDASNHVPLIVRAPGIVAQTVAAPIRMIDVAPTLLDLCGVSKREFALMDGCSLAPELRERRDDLQLDVLVETGIWLTKLPGIPAAHRHYPALVDLLTIRDFDTGTISVKPEWERAVSEAKDRAIRVGRWKLVCQPMEHGCMVQLFDVESDPECSQDISERHPAVVEWLWGRLRAHVGNLLPEGYTTKFSIAEATQP